MMLNKSAISCGLVSCSVSHAFFSQSRKLTFVPNQENLISPQNVFQEVMASGDFGAEFSGRIDRWIHFASQPHLSIGQRGNDLTERDLTHNKQVHIAVSPLLNAGHGAEDESSTDAVAQGSKSSPEEIGRTRSLRH